MVCFCTKICHVSLSKSLQLKNDYDLLYYAGRVLQTGSDISAGLLTLWSSKSIWIVYESLVPTSQKAHCIAITLDQLVKAGLRTNDCLFRESYKIRIYSLWAKCTFLNVRAGGTYSNHCALKSWPQKPIDTSSIVGNEFFKSLWMPITMADFHCI
jgi:hypothetical protein